MITCDIKLSRMAWSVFCVIWRMCPQRSFYDRISTPIRHSHIFAGFDSANSRQSIITHLISAPERILSSSFVLMFLFLVHSVQARIRHWHVGDKNIRDGESILHLFRSQRAQAAQLNRRQRLKRWRKQQKEIVFKRQRHNMLSLQPDMHAVHGYAFLKRPPRSKS